MDKKNSTQLMSVVAVDSYVNKQKKNMTHGAGVVSFKRLKDAAVQFVSKQLR